MTWVHDQIFAAGGEHIPSTWAAFTDQTGITAVLHITPGRPACFHGPPPEIFWWLNVYDEKQVDLDHRRLAAGVIQYCLTMGRRILIHSSLGRHRTRWAYVAFCIAAGGSVRAVLKQAAEKPWLSPYHTNVAAWETFAEDLRSNPVSPPLRDR